MTALHLPESSRKKIEQTFGERGTKWLQNFSELMSRCIEKWSLTNCTIFERVSINVICFAQSPVFGQVALKVGVPHNELFTEMKTLGIFGGRNSCKCYDYDIELGASLLERIIPGIDLTELADDREQLVIAADVISRIPTPLEGDHGLPTYADWIERAFKKTREEYNPEPRMLSFMAEAEVLFAEVYTAERPRVLLHGDLHHLNILEDQHGQWKAIDPQGVIGVACLESARFIENHIDYQIKRNPQMSRAEIFQYLDETVAVFAHKFGETRRIIASCLFILHVLSTCWGYEMNYSKERLTEQMDWCEIFLEYLRRQ